MIVRSLAFSLLALYSFRASAQEIKVVHKVEKDRILVKWLPSNYFALRKMSEGALVQRIEVSNANNLKSLAYNSGVEWRIMPLKQRYDALDLNDSTELGYRDVLEPIVNWVADKEQQNFAFGTNVILNVTDSAAQNVLGNFIEDQNFDASKSYAYKITVEGLKPAFVFVRASGVTSYPELSQSLILDNKTVVCSWDYKQVQEAAFAFDIEHSIGDTLNVRDLLDKPYLPFSSEEYSSDSASIRYDDAKKGALHYFRVIGRDAFGQKSIYSDWKSIYVPNKIEAYPIIDSVSAKGFFRFVSAHISSSPNADIEFVAFLRSKERDSNYELKEVRTYGSDSTITFKSEVQAETGDAFYYKVALINKDDSVTSQPFYFFTLDQTPPQAPEDLKIEIDSNGIVSLDWVAPIDQDIEGYRVFRANQKNEEFAEQTSELVKGLNYVDTLALNNLTSEVYYFVRAVDANFNIGASSDTVIGMKPDTIAPASGLIKSVTINNNALELRFTPSSSTDVREMVLYRNGVTLSTVDSIYIDTAVVAGNYYKYQLKTMDHSGNVAQSKIIEQKYEPGFREAPEFLAEVSLDESLVKLSWKLPTKDIYNVKIYKAKNNESPRLWKTIQDPSKTEITDEWISIGNTFHYSIIYTTKEGIQSLKSEASVQY